MNASLFNFIHQFAGQHPALDDIGIFFASYLIWILILGFLLLVLRQVGNRRKLYFFCEGALAVILARGIVGPLISFFYHHLRPFDFYGFTPLVSASGWSFPSEHMTFLFALATVVWYANKKWGIFYFILSLLVGIARIYAGVHWPYDILGGIVIGVVCATIIHLLFRDVHGKLYPKIAETET